MEPLVENSSFKWRINCLSFFEPLKFVELKTRFEPSKSKVSSRGLVCQSDVKKVCVHCNQEAHQPGLTLSIRHVSVLAGLCIEYGSVSSLPHPAKQDSSGIEVLTRKLALLGSTVHLF